MLFCVLLMYFLNAEMHQINLNGFNWSCSLLCIKEYLFELSRLKKVINMWVADDIF